MKRLVLIIFLLPCWIYSQNKSSFSKVEYITSDSGLSQNEVTCIIQDQKGFIWFGTRGGLNRFDGHNFKVFQNEVGNLNSLSNNSIESLYEDSKGNIWIGTKSNGLSRYDPVYNRFTHYQENRTGEKGLVGNRVISIAESSNNSIWVGTWNGGLTIIDPEKDHFKQLLDRRRIHKIISSSDNNMWVLTTSILYKFTENGKILAEYNAPSGSIQFIELIEDKKTRKLYLGSWNRGLWEFDRESNNFIEINVLQKNDPGIKNVYHLLSDDSGKIWIGSWNGGVSKYDPEIESSVHFDLSVKNSGVSNELYQDILTIFQDKSGVLWFGTNGGGVCKVDDRLEQFGLMGKNTQGIGLPKDPIWSIFKDNEGVLWVGEKGNKNIYYSLDGKIFNSLEIPNTWINGRSIMKQGVRTIFQGKNGPVYFSTNYNLYKIEKSGRKYKLSPVGIISENSQVSDRMIQVSLIDQTSDGVYWIGQQQRGLKKALTPGSIENTTFTSYLPDGKRGSIQSDRISAFLEDKSGRVWIGTYNGLHLYRPPTNDFLHYGKEQENINSLSSDIIICLHEDSNGNLWVGTPNGLNLAIPGINQSISFKCYQEKDGLPNNYIHAILEDNSHNLWISTNKGISKFDTEESTFVNFDVNDGLQSNSFMEGVALEDKNGLFFFGGINGLNVFHPDSIRISTVEPNVVFTALEIFNTVVEPRQKLRKRVILDKSIEYTKEITLSHQESVFSIEFSTMDFSSSGQHQYLYRMKGLEEEWHNTSGQTSITYSNIGSGEYVFQVKGANSSEFSNKQIAELKINLLPPFWATWQAFLLYALGFGGLLLLYRRLINQQNELLFKLNLSKLERKKDIELAEVKTQFFTNITHELRTPLTLISAPVEMMLEDESVSKKHYGHLHTIKHHSKRLLNLVNQLMDFRKAETGNMKIQVAAGDFVKYTKEIFISFSDLAEQNNILFQFNVSDKIIPLYFDRRNMEIVICNLLSNAFKYTGENGKIDLILNKVESGVNNKTFPDGYCEIIVEDKGSGMSKQAIKRIFDRFYLITKTNSVNVIGTGIGLALVKNIVDLHSGIVEVESEEGAGSKFIVKLPLGSNHFTEEQIIKDFKNPEHESHYQHINVNILEKEEPKTDPVNTHKEYAHSVLIVEDNQDIRNFIKKVLEEGYQIFEAENGKEGLRKTEKYLPDIILSDVMMPEMDGLAMCKFIKSNDDTSHIPVVLLTARTTNVYKVQGFQAGADAYITKPFQPSVLKANIESLLASRMKLKEQFSKHITLEPTDIEISSLDELFLKKAITLVEDNLTNAQLNREFLAKSMAVSSSSLYRKLKSLTGFTTNAFVRSIRLKRAAQMMRNSDYNISDIAYQVGFNDLKYFRTSFKNQFGMNPSEFLQKGSQSNQDLDAEHAI